MLNWNAQLEGIRHDCGSRVSDNCSSIDILESRILYCIMIDDSSFIGELATKMDTMDLSQGFKGFGPWVEKSSDI